MLDTVVFAVQAGGVTVVCGRQFSAELLDRIEKTAPGLSRRQLARQLCHWLNWKGPGGRLQEMSARKALVVLERRQQLQLPPVTSPFGPCKPRGKPAAARPAVAAVVLTQQPLAELGPIQVVLVGSRFSQDARTWKHLLDNHHYLGSGPLCGDQLRYLIRCPQGIVGALSFSAAAWQLKARDQWIGWDTTTRGENLHRVVNNSRFLLLPKVANLASHVLSQVLHLLPDHWEKRYGYRPVLVETFVDLARFEGTAYKAANWIFLGQTAGRGRNHRREAGKMLSPKGLFVYPLSSRAGQQLREPAVCPRLTARPRQPDAPSAPAEDWAQEELGQAALGDQRLQKRLCSLARDFYARPQAQVPQACGSRSKTKAAYRLMDHQRVTMETVLASHYQATSRRVAQEKVVLAVQDTTSLNYNTHPATENLGPIGSSAEGLMGLMVHDTMAFNLEGTPLGLLDVQCWARDGQTFGKRHQRKETPFEQKESIKWQRSLEAVARVKERCPQTTLVSVGDREADVYELFLWVKEHGQKVQLLIRAEHNRRVHGEHGYLWEQMEDQPLGGVQELRLPRRHHRPSRIARMEVRFGPVELRAPLSRSKLPNVRLWAVHAVEKDAPPGSPPVQWMLLSTLPVEDLASAVEKLHWYAGRWGIEVFHRTLKSGCKIETRQLGNADRIEACLAIDMVVAWRIYHLTKLGRETPDVPCSVYFEDIQWQALVGFINKDPIPPAQPPGLRQAIRMVASLGGFLGRKGDGEPGTQTIWLGLQRLDDIAEAWKVFSQMVAGHTTVSRNPTYG